MRLYPCARIMLMPILLPLLLTACGDGGIQGIKEWMDETRHQTKVSIPKLAEPKKFTPFTYNGKDVIDPYSPVKLAAAFAKLQANSNKGLEPDMNRRKDPLEAYPLDALRMVGTLEKPGLTYALLQVDQSVFQVKVGNYIGQNFGMFTNITDSVVELKEIVQDATGEWVERKAQLELQETKK
jgi:type IV pilus assembly protein PilP